MQDNVIAFRIVPVIFPPEKTVCVAGVGADLANLHHHCGTKLRKSTADSQGETLPCGVDFGQRFMFFPIRDTFLLDCNTLSILDHNAS
jgi:hypothetical protein